MRKHPELFEDIANSNMVKWYHRLWLWMFPVRIEESWTSEDELFRIYTKWVFKRLWVMKIEQLIYNMEKHVKEIRGNDPFADKILKPLARGQAPFGWGKEG